MADAQKQTVVKPKKRNMQKHENADTKPRAQNPRSNAGTQYRGPNPNFRPKQAKVPYNAKEEIAALKERLQESEEQAKDFEKKWIAAFDTAAQCQFRMDQLQKHFNYCKSSAEATIKDLKKQLAKARGNKPENNSDTVSVTDKSPITAKLAVIIKVMQEQSSHPAAELCGEPSTQATEVSHTDLKPAKEADLEVQCSRQQEQIQQLQQQLLETQRQLEEQATQQRLEREQFQCEINELKSQMCTNKDLHVTNLKHMKKEKDEKTSAANQVQQAETEKELLPQTSMSLQESAQEKQDSEQGKEEKAESLLQNVKTLQDFLKTKREEENILIAKLDKPEAQTTIVPEKKSKDKKKKKRHWLLRLFT